MSGKFAKIFISVAVLVFGIEYLFNSVLFQNLYNENMQAGIPWHQPSAKWWVVLVVADLIFAWVFTHMFLHGYERHGVTEGIRFGILVWLLVSVFEVSGYASSLNFGRKLTLEQTGADLVAFVIAGLAAGALAADAGKAKSASA